jgi:hypothetical protein
MSPFWRLEDASGFIGLSPRAETSGVNPAGGQAQSAGHDEQGRRDSLPVSIGVKRRVRSAERPVLRAHLGMREWYLTDVEGCRRKFTCHSFYGTARLYAILYSLPTSGVLPLGVCRGGGQHHPDHPGGEIVWKPWAEAAGAAARAVDFGDEHQGDHGSDPTVEWSSVLVDSNVILDVVTDARRVFRPEGPRSFSLGQRPRKAAPMIFSAL